MQSIPPRLFFAVFLLLFSFSSSAQPALVDSLWKKFDRLPADSSSVDTIFKDVLSMKQKLKNSPEEEKMLQRALKVATNLNYKRGRAEAYNLLGVYYRETSRFDQAIDYHTRALSIGKEIHDSTTICYSLNSMGVAYRRLDDNEKAFQNHFEALQIAKATGDTRNRSIAINSIANIHLSIGDYANAIEEFREGLELEKQMGRDIGQAINYANLGAAYEGLGKVDSAIHFYQEALTYNKLANSDKGIAITYNLLGMAHSKKKEYDVALSYLRQAISFNDKLRDRMTVADNYIQIGKVLQNKGETAASLEAIKKGLAMAKEIGSLSLLIDAYNALSITQSAKGDYVAAYEALKTGYYLRDSLLKEQSTPQMAKMRTLYELDKKEDQIKLLRQENEINQLKLRNRQFMIIAALIVLVLFAAGTLFYLNFRKHKSNRLKLRYELQSLRSQMNPHFIFNALNSIDNFIWQNEKELASEYLVKFSTLMRMTLQNSRSKSISMYDEIKFLELYLELENFRHNQKFNYEILVSPDLDVNKVLIPSMVVQPFVENAILHGLSHKEDGDCNLSIHFYKADELIVCEIEDNGIGRESSKEIQQSNVVSKQSVGIQVTEERVDLLKKITGNKDLQLQIFDVNDSAGEFGSGTKVRITLPLEYQKTV